VIDAPAKKTTGGFSDLGPRIGSAGAMIAAALVTLYIGGDLFVLFWLGAAVAVNWEWQRLVGGEHLPARYAVGGATVAVAAALGHLSLPLPTLAALTIGAASVAMLSAAEKRLWAGGGALYAGALAFSVCLLRSSQPYGLVVVAMLFAVVWGTDIFAYFGGRLIGGPKLWPAVSAGKTWSGTTALWRQGFEPAHSGPWRRHGPARRLHLRGDLRRRSRPGPRRRIGSRWPLLLVSTNINDIEKPTR